jgi:hypothetical protein
VKRARAAAGWLVLATLALAACSRTRELYVGSDFDPDRSQPEASGGPAPPGSQDAGMDDGTTAVAGRQAGAGVGGSAGSTVSGGSGGSRAPLPPPVIGDASVPPLDCDVDTADCDQLVENGCEADLTSDPDNCGDCGMACPNADCMCVDGVRLDCPAGHANCDADVGNGCETDLESDAEHCGGCGNSCTGGAGVESASCAEGSCMLTCALPNLRGDCDGDASNGCETDLFHDPNNCSACGMQCNVCADARCL